MGRVLIIGGGVAGPTAALALRKAGLEPAVYEAYPVGGEDVGAFLTIMNNGMDALAAIDAAEEVVGSFIEEPPFPDRGSITLGYAGAYSSFLKHAEIAAERYGVPMHEILLEAGRRGYVGGQEDLIIDIAIGLQAPAK